MGNTKFWLLLLFILLGLQVSVFAITPQEVLQKIDQVRAPSDSFSFVLKVTIKNTESNTIETKFKVRVKDSQKSIVSWLSPASTKGRVMLMVQDNLWIYFPGTHNPIRISPQQQIAERVSNADVARVVYSLDYKPTSMEDDLIDGKKAIKLSLEPVSKGAAYGAITLWASPEAYCPIKATFFALSGRKLKTAYYKNKQNILGKERPTILEIHDEIQKDEISTLEYSDLLIESTPDSYFQKSYLERLSQSQ